MDVRLHDDIDDFCRAALDVYQRDPVTATVELTEMRRGLLAGDQTPLLVTVGNGGAVVGAAMQTPPFPLLCSGLPAAVIFDVIGALVRDRRDLNGVFGRRDIATQFAAAWCAATGAVSTVSMRERLYRLNTLCPPTAVKGNPRPANQGDTDLLVDWLSRFHGEGDTPQPAATAQSVHAAQSLGDELLLWTLDGDAVSMAGVRAPVAGVSRIGPVYTPPDRRNHGYGSAVTAAAAAWARQAGAQHVVLFTDLANPVSNAIYQRIGFQPVRDSTRIDFTMSAVWQQRGQTCVILGPMRPAQRTV